MNVTNITLGQTKDCMSIQFNDSTGAYSSSNLGGYGSPNLTIANIQYSILQLSVFNDDYTNIDFNLATAQLFANGTTYNILNTVLAQPQTDFTPAVYSFNYIVFFHNPATTTISFTFTNGSNIVTYTNSGIDPFLSGIQYFQLTGDTTLYEVANISGDTASGTLQLTAPYAGIDSVIVGTNFYNGYSKQSYLDVTCTLQNCIASNIANSENCACEDNDNFNALAMLMAVQSNMAVANYTRVQEIINWLTLYCDGGDCGCH